MSDTRPARVAVIDDNPDDILLARLFLRRAGIVLDFETWPTAASFLAAMTQAPSRAPDLALLDLNLPGLSGVELLESIREAPWAAATTFVVCSGSTDPADQVAARRAGATAFLPKPLTEDSLSEICAAVPRFSLAPSAAGPRHLTIEPSL